MTWVVVFSDFVYAALVCSEFWILVIVICVIMSMPAEIAAKFIYTTLVI